MLPGHSQLMSAQISSERLGELRLGSVGITLNPHFLLDGRGNRTKWLVKRLRAARFSDPEAKLREFQHDHVLLERYFGAAHILPTGFHVLDRNFDEHSDYVPGHEYVMIQEYVRGTTLLEALEDWQGDPPEWLDARVGSFVAAYRALQARELAIPDCFSVRSEHVKVDRERQRLVLIDTNNVVLVRRDLAANELFQRYHPDISTTTLEVLHEVFWRICADYEFDRQRISSPRPDLNYREVRAIEQLVRYFPRDGGDNQYLRELQSTFPPQAK
jgi:hypothetical protein